MIQGHFFQDLSVLCNCQLYNYRNFSQISLFCAFQGLKKKVPIRQDSMKHWQVQCLFIEAFGTEQLINSGAIWIQSFGSRLLSDVSGHVYLPRITDESKKRKRKLIKEHPN